VYCCIFKQLGFSAKKSGVHNVFPALLNVNDTMEHLWHIHCQHGCVS